MKLVQGKTFASVIQETRNSSTGLSELLQTFGRVCEAVAHAHRCGIVHRDLKPANVMIGQHGEVQVMDWGLAKVIQQSTCGEAATPATHSKMLRQLSPPTQGRLGTPAYMPPEQARGELNKVDRRSDVFGLGSILCEILTGRPPYSGPNTLRLAQDADLEPVFTRLRGSGQDRQLVQLAVDCLSPTPADRPDDATFVSDNVRSFFVTAQERAEQARIQRERQDVRIAEERKRRRLWMGLSLRLVLAFAATLPLISNWVREQRVARWADRASQEHLLAINWLRMPDGSYGLDLKRSDRTLPGAISAAGPGKSI